MENQNIIKCATWNVRVKTHEEEKLYSLINKKNIKIAEITESEEILKDKMEA
jgi:hypothetical protein